MHKLFSILGVAVLATTFFLSKPSEVDRAIAALRNSTSRAQGDWIVRVGSAWFIVNVAGRVAQASAQTPPTVQVDIGNPTDMTLMRAPSLTAEQIDVILAEYGSPAVGTGATFFRLGVQYGIDPAYALAFFIHESGAGTASGWAGLKADGSSTHNIGNVICTPGWACYGRFRDYASWDEGIEDWYRLISVEYIPAGLTTVELVVPVYAPAFENDVDGYTNTVSATVAGWRKAQAPGLATKSNVIEGMVVNAGFYAIGDVWCFQSPDCQHLGADIAGSDGQAVHAPFSGTCIETGAYPEGGPTAGQYVRYVLPDAREVYLGHLRDAINCLPGMAIASGQVVGYIRADMLHTHWQMRDPAGNLEDPLAYWTSH